MKAFITGSRAYGAPREDSDIDLVVLMDADTAGELSQLAANFAASPIAAASIATDRGLSLRFGRMNLIIETDDGSFQDWIDGTDELKAIMPVTHEKAVDVFDRYRNARKEKRL